MIGLLFRARTSHVAASCCFRSRLNVSKKIVSGSVFFSSLFFCGKEFFVFAFCLSVCVCVKKIFVFLDKSKFFPQKATLYSYHSPDDDVNDNQGCFFLPRSLYGAWLREMRKRG